MKKILAIAALAAAFLFTGCDRKSDFNKYLEKDYEFVKAQYEGQPILFYEAQVELNGSPVEYGKKTKPATVREVFQVDTLVVFIDRNYETGEMSVEEVPGFWCEDLFVNPYGIADFKYALNALLNVKDVVTVPDAKFMTLRRPLGPVEYENAFYIFGSTNTSFVAVDARTLEIQDFSEVKNEGYIDKVYETLEKLAEGVTE